MKKRWLSLILSGTLSLAALAGLSACRSGGDDSKDKPSGEVGGFTESGTVYNAATAKDYTASRTDTRQAMYSAYKPDGTKIGDFKALANAINAAVANDAAAAEADSAYSFGSYVTQSGGSVKMFVNNKGYTSSNEECFWYYENGTSLDAYWCWDNTDTLGSLKNSKYITAHTQGYGTVASQTYNSYSVLDANGAVSETQDAASYELSTTLDAAVLSFPKRFGGVTKMTYEIDLSSVKITPAYTTGDEASDVYAFIGFYSWQDYYVINVGIACDVSTGNWYAYEGSSRDDSASDTKYNLGDCIMTSTWNEDGYFEPDADTVTISIETNILEDDMGEYQVNDFTAEVKDGATYKRRITSELVSNYFANAELSTENSYVFVAGLDVKNDISSGVESVNTDYFNGAKFENLTISKAEAYVPTVEEMSDVQYGYPIEADLRGKTHDMLLATGGRDVNGEYIGPIDYAVLNNNLCSSYKAVDGHDVYSFSYDMSAAGSSELGTNAKKYQDVIDSLADVTVDNVADYEDDIATVDQWYGEDAAGTGTTLAAKYRNVLDFTTYLAAKETQSAAVALTDAAQEVVDAFGKLSDILNYTYKGWTATDANIAGYMGSELAAFGEIKTKYDALTAEEKQAITYHISQTAFDAWAALYADAKAIESSANYSDEGFTALPTSTSGQSFTVTPANALENMAKILFTATEFNWDKDDTAQQGELVYIIGEYLKSLGMNVPELFTTRMAELEKAGGYYITHDYPAMAAAVKLGSRWMMEMEDTSVIKPAITEADAEIINKYFVSSWSFSTSGISWAIGNADGLWTFNQRRAANIAVYNLAEGFEGKTTYIECLQKVMEVLSLHGYTPDTSASQPYRVTEDSVTAKEQVTSDPGSLSGEAMNFYNAWLKIGSIDKFNVKGWSTDAEDTTGYFAQTAASVPALKTTWEALEETAQTAVADLLAKTVAQINEEIAGWMTFNTEFEALKAVPAFAQASITTLNKDGASVTLTGEQALGDLIYWSLRIYLGDKWEGTSTNAMDGDNSWYPSVYAVTLGEYLKGLEGVTLPSFLTNILTAVKYDNFLDAYSAIRQTVELAQAIQTNGYTTLSQLTEEQIAGLNKYWTSGYTINSILSWNWVSGHKFEDYMGDRVARTVKLFGGTLKAADGTTDLKFYEYNDIVGKFLESNGYTLDTAKNGWGVTAAEITVSAQA